MLKQLAMASLAVMVLVAAAEAQPGQGRGRGQGGFGRGGFGGGPGGNYMGLVRIEAVQTEIKVTEDQKASIDKLAEEQRAAREQERGEGGRRNFQDFQNLSEEERAARMEEFRKQAAEREAKSREQLAAILDDGQMQRLKQISIQLQGTQALSDEEVAKELGITDLQKEEIADTREEANREMFEQMRELFQRGQQDGDREANRAKFEELQKTAEEKVLANLSDDQKQKFTAMQGPKFEMPAGAFGFGGGGRFGQGGQGGRRPGGDGAEGGGRRRPGGDGGNDGGNRPRRPDSV